MPRSRNTTATPAPSSETPTTQHDNNTKENKKMATGTVELNAEMIQELLSKQKARGEYDQILNEFIESGVAGIEVSLTEGLFAGKAASNVTVGLNNAKSRVNKETNKPVHPGGKEVKVIKVGNAKADPPTEEHVYLINTAVGGES